MSRSRRRRTPSAARAPASGATLRPRRTHPARPRPRSRGRPALRAVVVRGVALEVGGGKWSKSCGADRLAGRLVRLVALLARDHNLALVGSTVESSSERVSEPSCCAVTRQPKP